MWLTETMAAHQNSDRDVARWISRSNHGGNTSTYTANKGLVFKTVGYGVTEILKEHSPDGDIKAFFTFIVWKLVKKKLCS